MYTQCPSCATLFSLGPRHLRQAQGLVRCCLCNETFDALETLAEALPRAAAAELAVEPVQAEPVQAEPEPQPEPQPEPAAPEAALRDDYPAEEPEPRDERPALQAVDVAAVEHADPLRELDLGAVELDEPPEPSRTHGWGYRLFWGLGSLLLIVALLVQGAYYYRDDLARYPQLRPALALLCQSLECRLPLPRALDKIYVAERSVAAAPERPGVLQVQAVLVNRAPQPQQYPQLGLRFSDLQGRPVAERWFGPEEYLPPAARAGLGAGMPAGEPVRVQLELADPGPQAANFQLEFR